MKGCIGLYSTNGWSNHASLRGMGFLKVFLNGLSPPPPHTRARLTAKPWGVWRGGGRALHMPLTVLEVENGQDFSEQRKDSFFTLCHLFRAFILAIALKA